MKRKVTLYVHRCPRCKWEAIRGEEQEVNFCSSCGHEGPPVVDTRVEEFNYPYVTKTYEEDLKKYQQSAEYLKRLEAGEDPAEIDASLLASAEEKWLGDAAVGVVSGLGSCLAGAAYGLFSVRWLYISSDGSKGSLLARDEESY